MSRLNMTAATGCSVACCRVVLPLCHSPSASAANAHMATRPFSRCIIMPQMRRSASCAALALPLQSARCIVWRRGHRLIMYCNAHSVRRAVDTSVTSGSSPANANTSSKVSESRPYVSAPSTLPLPLANSASVPPDDFASSASARTITRRSRSACCLRMMLAPPSGQHDVKLVARHVPCVQH